jgi:DNA mismatch endonuclease (patch repair protein)
MDTVSPEKRSRMMAAIKSRNTDPELTVRRKLHSMGFRFRLHRKDLPGKPDIVLPKYNAAVLVHGCFWHQHQGCVLAHWPRSREEYWGPKLARTIARDHENSEKLRRLGWKVIVVWECEIRKNPDQVVKEVKLALESLVESKIFSVVN